MPYFARFARIPPGSPLFGRLRATEVLGTPFLSGASSSSSARAAHTPTLRLTQAASVRAFPNERVMLKPVSDGRLRGQNASVAPCAMPHWQYRVKHFLQDDDGQGGHYRGR